MAGTAADYASGRVIDVDWHGDLAIYLFDFLNSEDSGKARV